MMTGFHATGTEGESRMGDQSPIDVAGEDEVVDEGTFGVPRKEGGFGGVEGESAHVCHAVPESLGKISEFPCQCGF